MLNVLLVYAHLQKIIGIISLKYFRNSRVIINAKFFGFHLSPELPFFTLVIFPVFNLPKHTFSKRYRKTQDVRDGVKKVQKKRKKSRLSSE